MKKLSISGLIAAILLLFSVQMAYAHAILLKSTPAAHQTVSGPDVTLELRYNSRIDGGRSTLTLFWPNGSQHILDHLPTSAPDRILAKAASLKPGNYVLHWQVLATDGHITRGEIPFTVK